jgi:pilus assembly protein Flp/PilA
MKKLFSNKKNEKGQGLVEYAIILALIAIVVIGVMTTLGKKTSKSLSKVSDALGPTAYSSISDANASFCAGNPGAMPAYFSNSSGQYTVTEWTGFPLSDYPSAPTGYEPISGGWSKCP